MNSRYTHWLVAVGFAATLFGVPGNVTAEQRIRELPPPLHGSDPEVPDHREPPLTYLPDYQGGVFDASRSQSSIRRALPSELAARPNDWLRRIVRLLRALHFGGGIR